MQGLFTVRGVVVGGAMLAEAPPFVAAAGERLERRLTELGADFGPPVPSLGMRMWSADAAAIVEALTDPEPMGIGSVALAGALDAVLSGDAFEATGNEVSVVNLVEHHPLPGWIVRVFERAAAPTVQASEVTDPDREGSS